MEHLSQPQRARLRQRLQEERARLQSVVMAEEVEAAADEETGDQQDEAAEENQRATARLRQRHATSQLTEVDAALARMDDGLYGVCEETDEPIPFARLELQPTTRYTVEALELLEDEDARAKTIARETPDEGY